MKPALLQSYVQQDAACNTASARGMYKKKPLSLPSGWRSKKLQPTSQPHDSPCHSTTNIVSPLFFLLQQYGEVELRCHNPLSAQENLCLPNTTEIHNLPIYTLKSTGPKDAALLMIFKRTNPWFYSLLSDSSHVVFPVRWGQASSSK